MDVKPRPAKVPPLDFDGLPVYISSSSEGTPAGQQDPLPPNQYQMIKQGAPVNYPNNNKGVVATKTNFKEDTVKLLH